jgi:hypothetical protein
MVTVDDALFKNYSIGPKKQAYRKVTDLPVKECHQRSKTVMGQVFSSGSRETIYLHEIKISQNSGPLEQFLSSGK